MYESLVEQLSTALLSGRPVIIRRIGTLIPYMKPGRRYIHPTTHAERVTKERWRVRFVTSKKLKQAFARLLSKRK